MPTPLSKTDAIELMKGDFGLAIRKMTVDYAAPLGWVTPSSQGGREAHNGTAFVIDGGGTTFVVTADHVFTEFLDAREKFGNRVICNFGQLQFEPENLLIDHDERLDIATFRISREQAQRAGVMIMSYDPLIPEIGKGIIFAGFPGKQRKWLNPQTIECGIFTGWTVARGVSERQITGRFEHGEYQIDLPGQVTVPPGYDIGGVSGAPLMTLVQTELSSLRLGGVMIEFKPSLDTFVAVRADFIGPDGTVRHV